MSWRVGEAWEALRRADRGSQSLPCADEGVEVTEDKGVNGSGSPQELFKASA